RARTLRSPTRPWRTGVRERGPVGERKTRLHGCLTPGAATVDSGAGGRGSGGRRASGGMGEPPSEGNARGTRLGTRGRHAHAPRGRRSRQARVYKPGAHARLRTAPRGVVDTACTGGEAYDTRTGTVERRAAERALARGRGYGVRRSGIRHTPRTTHRTRDHAGGRVGAPRGARAHGAHVPGARDHTARGSGIRGIVDATAPRRGGVGARGSAGA